MNTPICKECNINEVAKDVRQTKKGPKTYYRKECNACHSRIYRKENSEHMREYSKSYRKRTPELQRAIYVRKRHKAFERKKQLIEALGVTCCSHCKIDDVRVLTFHHLNDDKQFNLAVGLSGNYSFDKLLEEARKCQVLCANCHIIRHYKYHSGSDSVKRHEG